MVYSIKGLVTKTSEDFAVITVGGIGLKIFMSARALGQISLGIETEVFCHLHVREDALDLYGFPNAGDMEFFELLLTIAGVGPRSALSILDIADLAEISAAIQEGRPDLLTKAAGIGRKTADRIVLELKGKVRVGGSEDMIRKMESDSDLVETMVGLGYRRDQAKSVIEKIDKNVQGLPARLKEALKMLANKKTN